MSDLLPDAAERKDIVRLLRFIGRQRADIGAAASAAEALLRREDGTERVFGSDVLRQAAALGLVRREGLRLAATGDARTFLRRSMAEGEEVFLEQHRDVSVATTQVEGVRQPVRINHAESPLGLLARLKGRQGEAFLPPEAISAGERLHADFTRGQLQPKITACWEPRLASRSRGDRGGATELGDSALAARTRVARAVEAMGPELSGVALDACCFSKGLELIERERQWPARSAKLMLRTALLALARHYQPPRRKTHAGIGHWGAEDYRPEL
ncbi:DUF6456 domain-containing protein [Metarhizobium album]|uniref:DUF6456 domain-containing protein n=1 Tax=Metarhizobium album TaxID=2182425 RepID=UPI001FE1E295|nr:DUF6456 domain-containing protein [Rhizobium album]